MRTATIGFVIISILIFQSCDKGSGTDGPSGPGNPPPPPPPPVIPDSVYSIDRIIQPSNGSVHFNYDSKGRVTSYGFRAGLNFDSTIINYDASGKVISMTRYLPDGSSEHQVTPNVFVYQSGRVVKVIRKYSKRKGEYAASYLTDVSNSAEYFEYDTMIYNSNGKIIATKEFYFNAGIPNLFEYKNVTYDPANDSLYRQVDSYLSDGNGNFPLRFRFFFFTYSSNPNPFYNKIPLYSFLSTNGGITQYYILEYTHCPQGHNFLADVPRNSTQNSVSMNIAYIYTGSFLTSSIVNGNNFEPVGYSYKKVPK